MRRKKISFSGTNVRIIWHYSENSCCEWYIVSQKSRWRCALSICRGGGYSQSGAGPRTAQHQSTTHWQRGEQQAVETNLCSGWSVNFFQHQEKTDCRPLDLTNSSSIPRATKWTKFNKLNRMKKPGLSEAEFWGLLLKCDNCQKITTHEVFRYHLENCGEGHQHKGDVDTDTDVSESEQEI